MNLSRVITYVSVFLVFITGFSAFAQTRILTTTNSPDEQRVSPPPIHAPTNLDLNIPERIQKIRAVCIRDRRQICGRILKVLPEGLVIESGYTNLMRTPLNRSWLAPSTVTASRTPNLIEANTPGAVCIGLIFLSNIPKAKFAKAHQYDYVIVEGYPKGNYTYTSVGDIHRTVRRFSFSLEAAVDFHLNAELQKLKTRNPDGK